MYEIHYSTMTNTRIIIKSNTNIINHKNIVLKKMVVLSSAAQQMTAALGVCD